MSSLLAFVSGFVVAVLSGIIVLGLRARRAVGTGDMQALIEARAKQRQRERVIAALPDTLMRVDASHHIVELKMADATGEPSPLVKISRPLDAMFGEAVAAALGGAVDRSATSAASEVVEFEMRVRRALRHFEARVTKLGEGDALVVLRDVTEQKVTRAALERARAAAEAETRARADFLAKMSHDLRNPMTGVIGMTDLLLHGESDPRRRRRLEIIQRTGGYFVSIVNDILAFSRAEQGKLVLAQERTELDVLAADVLDLAIGDAEPKGLELFLHVGADFATAYGVDPLRIQQVLGNLVGNAVRFTDRGHVVVRLLTTSEGIEIAVEDTGIGIPEASKPSLFDPFVQGEAAGPRKSGGSGLGLAVVKQLVTLMEGTIDIETSLTRGSTFRVRLPFRPLVEVERIVPKPSGAIVLALADPIGKAIVEAALARVGVTPEYASDLAALDARLGQAVEGVTVLVDSAFVGNDDAAAERALARPSVSTVWVASALATKPPTWCPEHHRTLQHPLRRASLLACLEGGAGDRA